MSQQRRLPPSPQASQKEWFCIPGCLTNALVYPEEGTEEVAEEVVVKGGLLWLAMAAAAEI